MVQPLNILFVIQNLAGLRGGAERVLVQTARGLADTGHSVRIVSYDTHKTAPTYPLGPVGFETVFPFARGPKGPSKQTYGQKGLALAAIKRMPNGPTVGRLKWSMTHGLFARRLSQFIKRKRPDVVIAFLPPGLTAAAEAIKRLPKADRPKLVASLHNVPAEDFDDGSARWDQNPVYRSRARASLKTAQAITILQPEFGAWFDHDLQDRLIVMPNQVQRLTPPSGETVPRAQVILSVGRLSPVKGHAILIDAFARLHTDFPQWRVEICGEGPERAALSAQIDTLGLQDKIALKGSVANIGDAYDRASILCHPSSFEGFGLSVAEAMAHGCPPVAFEDCMGVNHLITDGHDGVLIATGPSQVDGLATALADLMGDQALRFKLGKQAKDIVTRFAPDHIINQWNSVLQNVTGADQ